MSLGVADIGDALDKTEGEDAQRRDCQASGLPGASKGMHHT